MGNTNNFEFTAKMKRNLIVLMGVGLLAIIVHLAILWGDHATNQRIWANLLIDTMFFLGISLLGLFFVATHTMAYGGWYVLIRRIPEAISGWIPFGAAFLLIIVLGTVGDLHHLYHWTDDFIVEDTVSVERLRAYELEHFSHHGDDHHGDEHGDDHGNDHHGNLGTGDAAKLLASNSNSADFELQQSQDGAIDVLKKGANKAGEAVEDGAQAVEEGAEKVIDVLKKGADKVGDAVEGAAETAEDILHGEHHDGHGHDAEHHGDAHSDDHHGDDHAEGHDSHGHGDSHAGHHGDDHHGDDHHGDDHGASHGSAHGGGHGGHGGDDSYKWHHGMVTGAVADHGHLTYAHNFEGMAGDKLIANPHFDKLIAGKRPYLNKRGFVIRCVIFILLWVGFRRLIRNASLKEDQEGGLKWYNKSKAYSAAFMVVFGVTSAMMAWDYLMSLDPHWFSTLYAWYIACSVWVACLAFTILLVTTLKNQGYLPQVNENHLHDVAKYMFGFSVFWTYLWFSQYMLYWYSNIPEETMYFHVRNGSAEFKFMFFANLFINFFTPFFVLMTRGAKRHMRVIRTTAVILIFGHWLDLYLAVMPGATASGGGIVRHFGLIEIGMFLLFIGMFLYVVFTSLSKAALVPQKHPFYKESVTHTT